MYHFVILVKRAGAAPEPIGFKTLSRTEYARINRLPVFSLFSLASSVSGFSRSTDGRIECPYRLRAVIFY